MVWTGTHFWAVGGAQGRVIKLTADWRPVGEIYPAADGTWGLAWDGNYLWTFQKTCELWQDPKMYQIEILASTATDYMIQWGEATHRIHVTSNSSDHDFYFNQPQKEIGFNITGRDGTKGYCNVTIPKEFLGGPFTVSLDGSPISHTPTQNSTHSFIYLDYTHSTHDVRFTGTTVIPEFPAPTVTPIVLVALAVLTIFIRRRV